MAMADGKQREAWNHTAHLLAMIDNRLTFDKRDKTSKPSDFHPFCLREQREKKDELLPNPLGIHVLKVFLPK
jgi:hypothetical protein